SISTWEDLTTRFLAQFFPPSRTAKLRLTPKSPSSWHQSLAPYDHVNPATRRTIDQSASGKLRDRNLKESRALLEDLALYDKESLNDPRDFAKPVKDARLSKFEADFNQLQGEITNKIDTVLKVITDRITEALPSDMVKNLKLNVNITSLVLSSHSYPTKDPQCSTRIHSSIKAITLCPKQPNKSRDDKSEEEGRKEKGTPKNINTTPTLTT
ncbi:hypothetical protein Tco_1558682, partial [Tanacetum coccineum]